MQIVITKAEDSLLVHARSLHLKTAEMYCVYFGVAGHVSGIHAEDLAAHLLSITNERLGEVSAMAYLCADGDIFVLCDHMPPAAMDGLFDDMRAIYGSQLPHYLYRCFALEENYEEFLMLCGEKTRPRPERSESADDFAPHEPRIDSEVFLAARRRRDRRSGVQILVVDDQQFSRTLVYETLGHDYELLIAKDGIQAIEAYAAQAPDLVLLDIGLPHYNGHEVLQRLIAIDPRAFVVMLTASNAENDVRTAIGLGAKGYIVKPFTRRKIAEYATACLQARSKAA